MKTPEEGAKTEIFPFVVITCPAVRIEASKADFEIFADSEHRELLGASPRCLAQSSSLPTRFLDEYRSYMIYISLKST